MKYPVLAAIACAIALVNPVLSTANAQQVRTEVFDLNAARVTVHLQPFLTEDELATLRLVGQNQDALALFMPGGARFGALAVAPADGFIRDGMPVDSASALSDLPDRRAAQTAALARCNTERSSGPACVIVLEVAPR